MPQINLSFRGYCRADVSEATNVNGETVDVTEMAAESLCEALEKGELFISLGDHLYSSGKNEIEIFDFEALT